MCYLPETSRFFAADVYREMHTKNLRKERSQI